MRRINEIIQGDCLNIIKEIEDATIDLTFLDPPFNQGKEYKYHNDSMDPASYWKFMKEIVSEIFKKTKEGGSLYFMQREKNTEQVLEILRITGWNLQNLIIWRKKTSPVPLSKRYGLNYQIIAFVSKGSLNRFNRLRILPPILDTKPMKRSLNTLNTSNSVYVTDTWVDINELNGGFLSGNEPFRDKEGTRIHNQQSPIELLLRIILSSTLPGDIIFDPFSGTGTSLVVAKQLKRNYLGIEIDPDNVSLINKRLETLREADNIEKYFSDYIYTEELGKIWGTAFATKVRMDEFEEEI